VRDLLEITRRRGGKLAKEQRRVNFSNRPIYQRRRRVALLIVVLLIVLLLVVLFLIGRRAGETGGEQIEQVNAPTIEQAPEIIDEQTTGEEDTE
jgi:cell division septal protein FtsQ